MSARTCSFFVPASGRLIVVALYSSAGNRPGPPVDDRGNHYSSVPDMDAAGMFDSMGVAVWVAAPATPGTINIRFTGETLDGTASVQVWQWENTRAIRLLGGSTTASAGAIPVDWVDAYAGGGKMSFLMEPIGPVIEPVNACDLNADGAVDGIDVEMAIETAAGNRPCSTALAGTAGCDARIIQRVVNGTTGACVTGASRPVLLSWVASTSENVKGYNAHRSESSGGPYTLLSTSPVPGTTFVDYTVQPGKTYYYVVTAVSTSDISSAFSNEAMTAIPESAANANEPETPGGDASTSASKIGTSTTSKR